MRVALFATCLIDALFPDAGRATVQLLERLGQRVEFPLEQTCCGQMHANSGYFEVELVGRYVDVFSRYDAVVVPSASCAASIHHQHPMIARAAGDEALAVRAESVGSKTYELSQFLIDVLGTDDVGAYFPHRVTYHPTCHSVRLLGVGDRPLRLLRNVRGIDLVELPRWDECCGFGGTFAIKNPDTSAAMLADKMDAVIDTGAEVLCAGDRSCLMHIGGGLERIRAGVRTLHLVEILASTEDEYRPDRAPARSQPGAAPARSQRGAAPAATEEPPG
ncbi:MAG: (Fe-S)-binding protein [Solirubrobacterales bacterium]|nr:(Fe-S)-binding protein [Solirubrobacterales bacterium]MBV9801194.1 (Fe-S)-binding protein [Solirubrobacterales bacterium]